MSESVNSHRDGGWQQYVGRSESTVESVSRRDLAGLAAVLGHPVEMSEGRQTLPWAEQEAPPFAHWLHVNPLVAREALGPDGHPLKGGFIPDIPLPRRMWAGSRVEIHAPYAIGAEVMHRRTIKSVVAKSGRSGELVFVTLLHEYFAGKVLLISEEQDLVYRERPPAPFPIPEIKQVEEIRSTHECDWFEVVTPDPVWLFHYSAVSLNGHRIHYDREYATAEEGYPGLVVQGPLSAILLLDRYRRWNPDSRIARFECVARAPLFDTADFYLLGGQSDSGAWLSALRSDGEVAMQVSVNAIQ